ncbi:hypothetical protein ACN469_11890 [Corallococcus terminator]
MRIHAVHCCLALATLSSWSCGSSLELEPAARTAATLDIQTVPGTFSFAYGIPQNKPVAIASTPDGGYVTGGTTYTIGGGTEAWVIKFDAGGGRVWEWRYGTSAEDSLTGLLVASNGDIVFTGSMRQGSLNGSHDVWLVRLSSVGDVVWQKAYGGVNQELETGGHEQSRAVIETGDGSLVVVGETSSFARSGASYDVAVAAFFLEVAGNSGEVVQSKALVWSRYYNDAGRRNTSASSIVQTADGGFAVAGGSDRNFWAVKLGRDGVPQWMNHYGYTTHDQLDSLVQDSDGHLVLAGSTCNTSGSDCDVWTVKAAQDSGDFVWVRKFDGASYGNPYRIQKTTSGFVVAGTYAPVGTSSNSALWLVQLDGEGNLGTNHSGTWQKTYGGLRGSAITPRSEGGFLFAGLRARLTASGTESFFVGTDAGGDVACPAPVPTDVSSTQGALTREVCPLPPTGESCCTDSACDKPDSCERHENCVSRVCIPKPVDWIRDHTLTARDTVAVANAMSGTKVSCQ